MTIHLYQLTHELHFPHPDLALDDPNGLLAFGGDLSTARLLTAYSNGIFPWFSEEEPLLWWSPSPRGVLFLEDYHASKSFKKFLKNTPLRVTLNHAFEEVIEACATIPRGQDGTWITEEMIDAYKALHKAGHAHSIEVWLNENLVGGLYGVNIGSVFCGESMFHTETNASKLAFHCLVNLLLPYPHAFIDCQMPTPHLSTLGVSGISRAQFLKALGQAKKESINEQCWEPRSLFSENSLNLLRVQAL